MKRIFRNVTIFIFASLSFSTAEAKWELIDSSISERVYVDPESIYGGEMPRVWVLYDWLAIKGRPAESHLVLMRVLCRTRQYVNEEYRTFKKPMAQGREVKRFRGNLGMQTPLSNEPEHKVLDFVCRSSPRTSFWRNEAGSREQRAKPTDFAEKVNCKAHVPDSTGRQVCVGVSTALPNCMECAQRGDILVANYPSESSPVYGEFVGSYLIKSINKDHVAYTFYQKIPKADNEKYYFVHYKKLSNEGGDLKDEATLLTGVMVRKTVKGDRADKAIGLLFMSVNEKNKGWARFFRSPVPAKVGRVSIEDIEYSATNQSLPLDFESKAIMVEAIDSFELLFRSIEVDYGDFPQLAFDAEMNLVRFLKHVKSKALYSNLVSQWDNFPE